MTRAASKPLHARDLAAGGTHRLVGTKLVAVATKTPRRRAKLPANAPEVPRGACFVALRTRELAGHGTTTDGAPWCIVPIRTKGPNSGGAAHEHWATASKRARREKALTRAALLTLPLPVSRAGLLVVLLTRLSPGVSDDDSVVSSLKFVRDIVAAHVGIDDGERSRLLFAYEQQEAEGHGVRIELRWQASRCVCCAGRGWHPNGARCDA